MSENKFDENNNPIQGDEDETLPESPRKKNKLTKESSSSLRPNNPKKSVYEYDSNEIYELFLHHGVSLNICEKLLANKFNGEMFKEWPTLTEEFVYKIEFTDHETKHLSRIKSKYMLNPLQSKNKLMCDNLHGQISIHPLLIKIIDTPQFQRLRYLKQLGTLVYVYPTGSHSRFEHCIGTSHIAGLFMRHLKENQPELKITNADELCVKIAGLCHDLGHGPFSHMFEETIQQLCPESNWKHEKTTIKLFEKMLSETKNLRLEFESYGLFEDDLQLIKDLIYTEISKASGYTETYTEKLKSLKSLQARGLEKSFLFEIISNNRNGIDVDKFDYFDRDCIQMGFTNNFNYKRYIACTKVIKTDDGLNQICVRDKEISNLYEMYHVRELLTRRAYKHETASSINLMIMDALVQADKHFKFSEIIQNCDYSKFEKLNDGILHEILNSESEILKESRLILERVGKRKLYKYVGSIVLPDESICDNSKSIKQDLIDFMFKTDNELNGKNIVVEVVRFNYGSKNKNPLENVKCYSKNSNRAFKMEKEQISRMLLNVFEDKVIRVYSKKIDDFDFVDHVYKTFSKWCKRNNFPMPLYGISEN